MRFPFKYILIDGQWYTEDDDGYQSPARPESSLDVLVNNSWQMGAIEPGPDGKWMVTSHVSWQAWELQEGQWAFFRPGPYDWVHPLRPSGKCFCDVYRIEVDAPYEVELGTILMDLSMDELGLYEDVFFWGR